MPSDKRFLPDHIVRKIQELRDWPRPLTEDEMRHRERDREERIRRIQEQMDRLIPSRRRP